MKPTGVDRPQGGPHSGPLSPRERVGVRGTAEGSGPGPESALRGTGRVDPRSSPEMALTPTLSRGERGPENLRRGSRRRFAVLAPICLVLSGCLGGVDAHYGRSRGPSVNGTGGLAEMMRGAGHTVRAAVRLGDELNEKADAIVRFAPRPGPPAREEAAWYQKWLEADPRRRLVYVPQDFDAESEYWAAALAAMPASTTAADRQRAEERRVETAAWAADLPPRAKEAADPDDWFAVERGTGPVACKALGGPWAEGVDAAAAALTRHDGLKENGETILLTGDGVPLALEWHWPGHPPPEPGASTLVVANGSFLLNEPLARRARRPLARRVVAWLGPAPLRVVFVEGAGPTAGNGGGGSSPFDLLRVAPLGTIFGHAVAALLLVALSRAVILGRPIPAPPSDADRPAAHPEALGTLLARTRDVEGTRALLETYRRWRHPSAPSPTTPRGPRP